MKRQICVAFLCVSMLLSSGIGASAYLDTGGHWAEAAIQTWTDNGVIKGDGERFRPDAPMTRGELAALLSGTLGLTGDALENPFTDAPEDAWYTPALLRCHEAGLISGFQGKARPTEQVNRQEAAVMLARALAIPASGNQKALERYADAGQIADWAAGYAAALTERGVVSGVGGGRFAPTADVTRASVVTILDHAVLQYIHAPGRYTLADGKGVILVAAGGVTLTGASGADLLITPAADGGDVTFDRAALTGAVTVQADRAAVILKDSSLTPPSLVGAGTEVRTADSQTPKPSETPRTSPSGGGSHSSGSSSSHDSGSQSGSGDSSGPEHSGDSQTPQDLVISQTGSLERGSYRDVWIAASVGNGTVVLKNLTISRDLYVQGGGSHSVRLVDCTVLGKIIMDKAVDAQSEPPRLALTGTPVHSVEVRRPAILESEGSIDTVIAKDQVTMAAGTVGKLEIPAEADGKQVQIHVERAASVTETVVNSQLGAQITGDGQIGGVRAGSEEILQQIEVPSGVTVSTHDHVWDGGTVATAPTCTAQGVRTFRCTLSGCTATKSEPIPALSHRWGQLQQGDSLTHKRVCEACGAEDKEAHSFGSAAPDGDGHKAVCSVCQAEKREPHTSGEAVPEDGGHKFVCEVCGAETSEPHVSGEAVPSEDGLTHETTCTVCHAALSTEAHTFGDPVQDSDNPDSHKSVCPDCGYAKSEPHVSGGAVPTKDGLKHEELCSVCHAELSIEAHTFGESVPDTDNPGNHKTVCPDCGYAKSEPHVSGKAVPSEDGLTHKKSCTVCHAALSTEAHTFGNPVQDTDNPDSHKLVCPICDYTKSELHSWDNGEVIKAPTTAEAGTRRYTCTSCKATRDEVIPQIQEQFSTVSAEGMIDQAIDAASGQPISFTLTLPEGAALTTTAPMVTCTESSILITNIVVENSRITFTATPSNLTGELKVRFCLSEGDTDLPYAVQSQEICFKAGQTLTATGTVTPSRFQLTMSEPVDFYDAEGRKITSDRLQDIANIFVVYRNGKTNPMCNLFRLESFDGTTLTCSARSFSFGYEEDSYFIRISEGAYISSKTSPKLRLEGDIPLVYAGPQSPYANALYSRTKHTLDFSIEANDGIGDENPSFDFTKLLVVQAPGGDYKNALSQTPLAEYALSSAPESNQSGTFRISLTPHTLGNDYLIETSACWDVTVYLSKEDEALFQAINDGECLLALDPGFCTGSAGKRVYFLTVVFK